MAPASPSDLKRMLIASGFEIYRTSGDEVVLAERVRDNLLMDSGVRAVAAPALAVRLVMRTEALQFPGEGPDELLSRARRLASALADYREVDTRIVPIRDPGDASRTLDTWHEVWLERSVETFDELVRELRRALSLERIASAERSLG